MEQFIIIFFEKNFVFRCWYLYLRLQVVTGTTVFVFALLRPILIHGEEGVSLPFTLRADFLLPFLMQRATNHVELKKHTRFHVL